MTNRIVAFLSENITNLSIRVLFKLMTSMLLGTMIFTLFCSVQSNQLDNLLNRKLNLDVYASERLESILFRLELYTESRITFEVQEMLSYKAKPAKYENALLKEILEEQLAGTPFRYKMHKNKLLIYNYSKGYTRRNIYAH